MVNDSAIYFLGHSIVITPISGLHMINRDTQPLGTHCRQAAVRITQHKKPVGLGLAQYAFHASQDRANLLSEASARAQVMVRLSDIQFSEENLVKILIVVLSSVHNDMRAQVIEFLNDAT